MNKYTGECAADCVYPRKKSFSVTNRFTLIQPCGYASPVVNLETEQDLVGISVPSGVVLYIAKRISEGDHTEKLRVCLHQNSRKIKSPTSHTDKVIISRAEKWEAGLFVCVILMSKLLRCP